jgi:hypothetical protein
MARPKRPNVGDVVKIPLPSGRVAFGRVLRDASIAVYKENSDDPCDPPIGSRDYRFVVGIYDDALRGLRVVAHDPNIDADDKWPPPYQATDVLTGQRQIYHRGEMRPESSSDPTHLEPAAVWDLQHIVDRIEPPSPE